MTILILHPNLTERGGAERKVLLLAKYLKEQNKNVKILCFRYQKETSFSELICDDDILFCDIRNWYFLVTFLFQIFKQRKFEVLVVSNYPAHLFGIFVKSVMPKKRMIWICNEVNSLLHPRVKLKHKIIMWFEKRFISRFDVVIANSQNTKRKIQNFYKIFPVVVYPGLNLNSGNSEMLTATGNYFFCISRLTRGKNIEFLERILTTTNRQIILAGDGEMKPYVEKLCKKFDHLEYRGRVSDADKFKLYRGALATLFLPVDEPFGVTNIEAINEGCPVIAFNRGGPCEIITHGKNGYLCENEDVYLEHIKDFKSLRGSSSNYSQMMQKKFGLKAMLLGLSYFVNNNNNDAD